MRKLLALILLLSPITAFAGVEITYVECNPVGSDADGEFIKIQNTGSTEVDITGWKFFDGSNHILNIPPKNGGKGDMLLSPGEVAMLANKADKVSGESTIIDTVMSLSNSGDTLKLFDASGAEVTSVTYSKEQVVEGGSCISYVASDGNDTGASGYAGVTPNIVTEYRTVEIEPPQDIYLRDMPEVRGLEGGYVSFNPEVYDATGRVSEVSCYITFGDGATTTECAPEHVYTFAGEYVAQIRVNKGTLSDGKRVTVRITEPQLYVSLPENKEYVELHNDAPEPVELNGWSIKVGYKRFKVPAGTVAPALGSIKISQSTMKINIAAVGGTAELYNVFNKRVHNPTLTSAETVLFTQEQEESVATETPPPEISDSREALKEALEDLGETLAGEVSAAPVVNKSSAVSPESVALLAQTTQGGTDKAPPPSQTAEAPPVATTYALSAAASAESSQYWPWVLGVLGLCILALLPLLRGAHRVRPPAVADRDNDVEQDTFTLTEIK